MSNNKEESSQNGNSFLVKTFSPLTLPILLFAQIFIYFTISSFFKEYSLFRPDKLDLQIYEEQTFFMLSLMWYIFLIATIYFVFDAFETRIMIVDEETQSIKIKSKFRGTILDESFSKIDEIKFQMIYDNENEKYKILQVLLIRDDDSEFRLLEGYPARYKRFKAFISKYSDLEKLIEVDENI